MTGRGRGLQTKCSHAFLSSYRHEKYELRLIFLPGVIGICVLRTLGIYLGGKLTSVCGWGDLSGVVSAQSQGLHYGISSLTLSLPKLIGKGALNKDMEQCNSWYKGPAGPDRRVLLRNLMCQGKTNNISLQE